MVPRWKRSIHFLSGSVQSLGTWDSVSSVVDFWTQSEDSWTFYFLPQCYNTASWSLFPKSRWTKRNDLPNKNAFPVGCVPLACWPCPIVLGGGVSARGGVCLGRVCTKACYDTPPRTEFLTYTLWKHYFPATNVAGGKYETLSYQNMKYTSSSLTGTHPNLDMRQPGLVLKGRGLVLVVPRILNLTVLIKGVGLISRLICTTDKQTRTISFGLLDIRD